MATWSQIFRALALKLAKIQRWKEKGVIFQFSFKNPGIAKKALVKNIFFFILELTFCNYLSFSIEKSRVFLKKTWWQVSSSVQQETICPHKWGKFLSQGDALWGSSRFGFRPPPIFNFY